MPRQPTEIRRGNSGLSVAWTGGTKHELPAEFLRRNCPCATCREARGDESHAKPLTSGAPKKSMLKVIEHTLDEEVKITQVWAVGTYAIGIEWGDGHSTGIYTYDYLFELGEASKSHAAPPPPPPSSTGV